MTSTRLLTLVVSTVLLASSLTLLFPTPLESQQRITEYYKQQQSELSNDLDKMKVTAAELEKSIAFSKTRQMQEMWLRWGASFLFFTLILASVWRYMKAQSVVSKVGLFVTSVTYLMIWFSSVIVLGDPSRTTVLDAFIGRVLNELAVGSPILFARFFLLYGLAPLASIALLSLLLSNPNLPAD